MEAGGGGTGATSEARSRGGRAGSEGLGTERSLGDVGGCGGLLSRPGGGEMIAEVVVKKVRLGLVVMGVPSSSSCVGGRAMEWDVGPRV